MKGMHEKEALRGRMRAALGRLAREDACRASAGVLRLLSGSVRYREAGLIGIYAAIGGEIDLKEIVSRGSGEGRHFALPAWDPGRSLYEFAILEDWRRLESGRFGILEPAGDARRIGAGELDMMLVPGLAFTLRGVRLGRGKGFYDRLLQASPGWRIGVAHEFQILDSLPEDPWDRRVDGILTPERWHMSER